MFFSWILPANLRWIAVPTIIVLTMYSVCRLVFVWMYPEVVSELNLSGWVSFFILSLRFDLSTLATLNLIFLPLLLVPFPRGKLFWKGVRFLFAVVHGVFLLLNAIDIPFFAFNTRRTSYPALQFLLQDSIHQIPQLILHYWPVPLIVTGAVWMLVRSFGPDPSEKKPAWIASVFAFVIWCGLSVMLIRNSFQLKPMLPGEAFTLPQSQAGHAVLNTPFLLFKSIDTPTLPDVNWIPEREMSACFSPIQSPATARFAGYNLVLIILESFSSEYTGLEKTKKSYTPFLDSLARKGTYFPHHYANGRTSRDALPSILASVPAWMDEAFASSPYVSTRLEGLGNHLMKKGYKTAFFHGGRNGTMSFDLFSRIAGFERYFGMNEYSGGEDFDGNWGIFDEPFLQFTCQKLNEMPPPFAAGVFTLSSHQPYTIPQKYQNRFPKGTLPIHEAIGYSDFALRRFFEEAQKQTWYSKTLFVITADHTQESDDPAYSGFKGRFDVPLLFYCPTHSISADTSRWVQHLDIAPSVLELLGRGAEGHNPLGTSVFSDFASHPIEYQDDNFHLIHPEGILVWKAEDPDRDWTWIPESGEPEPAGLRKQMMARIQFYRKGLLKNRLFPR